MKTSRVRFLGPLVAKTDPTAPELNGIARAFAPGFTMRATRVMLRGRAPVMEDLYDGHGLLARHVWSMRGPRKTFWRRDLLDHLWKIYPSPRLMERVAELPEVLNPCCIHGDATLANLVVIPFLGPRWIDPLDRVYIPGDPKVDLGKMMQSAWGYERLLANERRFLELNPEIAQIANDEDETVETWFLVHAARLLRYHSASIAARFAELLEDEYGCRRV